MGLLGANGAGKTTLMRVLLGLLPATSGTIMTLGTPAAHIDHNTIGYVSQSLGLYAELTVRENLDFVASAFGVDSPVLEPQLELVADHHVGDLPLGLKRRAAFVAAGCHSPEILVLDEPTSGVGPLGRAELWEVIHHVAEQGAGVLVSTHYMEEAEECDRVIVMANGREVASGPVDAIVGSLRSVLVANADAPALGRLQSAGLTVLADGVSWRVVDGDRDQVVELVGNEASVEYVPATFEEAFVKFAE